MLLALQALVMGVAAIPMQHGLRNGRGEGRSPRPSAALDDAYRQGFLSFQHDINIVHLTDVHSWLSGHMHEPNDEADYPDVLAFFEHLQAMAHAKVDLLCPANQCWSIIHFQAQNPCISRSTSGVGSGKGLVLFQQWRHRRWHRPRRRDANQWRGVASHYPAGAREHAPFVHRFYLSSIALSSLEFSLRFLLFSVFSGK